MLSLLELLMTQQMKRRKFFLKMLKEMRSFKSQKVLCKSTPASSHDSINVNHRQISLTGTDHYNSKLSKVIQFEKKQLLNFLSATES